MEPNRYFILTRIEAGERRRVYEYKLAFWKKYALPYALLTLICWIAYALITLDIIFADKDGIAFGVMGVVVPGWYISTRALDVAQWRPPTAEEMNELGDKII